MGLFSKLFGKKNATTCTVTAAHQKQNRQQPQQVQQQQQRTRGNDNYMSPPAQDLRAEVSSIFRLEFSSYQVTENVDVKQIDASASFGGPIDFAVYNNGRLVAILMILDRKGKRNKRVYGAMLAAQKNNVPFLNLYTHFPFSRTHAVDYIKRTAKI